MKTISNQKHRALITALGQLDRLALETPTSGVPEAAIREGLQTLVAAYERYEHLLAELAKAITEYEALHHHLKVQVLAPGLRRLHSQAREAMYFLLREAIIAAKAV